MIDLADNRNGSQTAGAADRPKNQTLLTSERKKKR